MRRLLSLTAVFAVVAAAGCSDATRGTTAPRQAQSGFGISKNTSTGTMGACTTLSALDSLAAEVFGAGSPNVQSVVGKLGNLDHFVQIGDTTDAHAQAENIVSFVQMKAAQGTLPGTTAQINAFLAGVLCYAGLSPNTYLIQPTDNAQTLVTNTGNSGISLQAHTVSVPTLLTIDELDPSGPSGLITKLDQYPTYINIHISSPLLDSAVVAVCIPDSLQISPSTFSHLRLGHQATTGFEITPEADPSFLGCPTSVASNTSKVPAWLRELASLVLPRNLYASSVMYATGGVGGSAIEFSPFGAVDNSLYSTGGVGGSAIEFQKMPSWNRSTPGTAGSGATSAGTAKSSPSSGAPAYSVYDVNGNCISSDTTVGQALSTLCRPVVTIRTGKGTLFTDVPVTWAVTGGGGTIADDTLATNGCGLFDTTVSNATDANGQAGVCWTLGPSAGTNTVTATPHAGGDAPNGVVFVDANGTPETGVEFTATGDRIPTTANAVGDTGTYNGLPLTGSGSCSNSLTPALSYNTIDGQAPVNAGSYTLTVTCGANSDVYAVSTASATLTITPATPDVTVGCPDSVAYTGSPLTPCSGTVTGPGLSETVTPTYANNTNVGTAMATVAYTGSGNYTSATGTATFRITKAASATAVTCPASVAYDAGATQNPCTATATGAGGMSTSVTVTYAPSPLHDAGTYTASAAFAGDSSHYGSTGSTQFAIVRHSATATAGSGTMLYNGSVPTLPCTVTGLLSPDAGAVTCTTAVPATLTPGNNATTPVVSPSNPVNYAMTSVNGTLAVHYVQSDCFASPIYSSQPPTKSAQKLGSNLPIKCTLLDANGNAVTGASGDLTVIDKGTDGSGNTPVFHLDNAYSQQKNKNYSYGFDTSILTSGHFYFVETTWNDGSTTTGWFYVK